MIKKIALANAILLVQYAVSAAIPLALVPRIVSVIGLTQFGKIAILLGWASYAAAIVQYAFQLVGPKRAMQLKCGETTKTVFIEITATKLLLLTFVSAFLILGVMIIPDLRPNNPIELLLFSAPVAACMNSTWLLQAKDKFSAIAIIGIVGSLVSIYFGFSYIKPGNQYSYEVSVLVSVIGALIVGLATMLLSVILVFKEDFDFNVTNILDGIKNGWPMFISQFISMLYTGAGPIVIGFTLNAKEAGIYSVIERMANAIMSAALLTHTAAYPRLASLYLNDKKKYLQLINFIIMSYFIITTLFSVVVLWYKQEVILYLYGNFTQERQTLLISGLVWVIIGIFGPVLTGYLVVSGNEKRIWPITLKILLLSLALGFIGLLSLGVHGWLWGLVISQGFNLMIGFKYFKREFSMLCRDDA